MGTFYCDSSLPRLSISLPALARFIGQQMIASADELEAEKPPLQEEASNEPEAEEQVEKEAEITEKMAKEEVPHTEGHSEDHDEEKQEAST